MNGKQMMWTYEKCLKMVKQLEKLLDGTYDEDTFWNGIIKASVDVHKIAKYNKTVGKAMVLTSDYMAELMKLMKEGDENG